VLGCPNNRAKLDHVMYYDDFGIEMAKEMGTARLGEATGSH